jgi:uncharacterized protein YfcZ (UPF0381/DUF406 family)
VNLIVERQVVSEPTSFFHGLAKLAEGLHFSVRFQCLSNAEILGFNCR